MLEEDPLCCFPMCKSHVSNLKGRRVKQKYCYTATIYWLYINMYILVLNFMLFYSSSFAFADDLCVTQSPCRCVLKNNMVIDLSSVGSSELIRFHDVAFITECNSTALYSYSPCIAFKSSDTQTTTKTGYAHCADAAACVKTPGGNEGQPPEEHAIGLQNTAVFYRNPSSDAITINYTALGAKLQVILNCTESPVNESQLSMMKLPCVGDEPIVLVLSSKCACPNGCPSASPSTSTSSGLSTGSKLLIAFFTLLFAYLLVGVVWNFCNGSHGMELIPNIEFWNGLPTLIMEGVVFTCSCCIGKRSYGEV